MNTPTATYVWQDDEQDTEFEVELEYETHDAEPDVGIMHGGISVTGIAGVEGRAYLDGHAAEFKPSDDPKSGWESVVRRRLMDKYSDGGPIADAMNRACNDEEVGKAEYAAEMRAELRRENRSPFYSRLTG